VLRYSPPSISIPRADGLRNETVIDGQSCGDHHVHDDDHD
jgi:hypothetical protein